MPKSSETKAQGAKRSNNKSHRLVLPAYKDPNVHVQLAFKHPTTHIQSIASPFDCYFLRLYATCELQKGEWAHKHVSHKRLDHCRPNEQIAQTRFELVSHCRQFRKAKHVRQIKQTAINKQLLAFSTWRTTWTSFELAQHVKQFTNRQLNDCRHARQA